LISVIVSCAEKSKFPKVDFIINPDDEKIILSNGELIVLVFSANDCSMCVDNIVTLLNDINDNSNENIKIIGILNTKYRQALDKVRYNYGINFTLLQVSCSTTKRFFSNSSYLIQKPIVVHLRNGNILSKGIIGEQDDQFKIRDILTYLK